MKDNKFPLKPLPHLSKEQEQEERLNKLSARKRMEITRVVPSSQGLVADFMSLLHLEMSKLAGKIGNQEDCLDETSSKHLSRLINSLDRLVGLEENIRGQSAIDRMDDKELKDKITKAAKALKMSDKEIEDVLNKDKK
jgi:hypothetical protein